MDNNNIRGLDEMMAKLHAIKDYIANDVPDVIGVEATNFFKKNFERESFGSSGKKWESRKGTASRKKTLTKSGELADSIDYTKSGNTVTISTDKEYAQIHNEGGEIVVTDKMRSYFWAMFYESKNAGQLDVADSWRGLALSKKIVMPERKYIGYSEELMQKIKQKILKDLKRITA